ncbi:MAG: OmpH family outer membrane protein [Bacteroidaceae bacterium]|nr:OmpH family outer membrane protein [Bacteroidaceae bacterium]MBR2458665.1 OmpH family outer membrane protein [Bacteroidaceae bacterium]
MKKYLFLAMSIALGLASCSNNKETGNEEVAQTAETEATGLRIAYVELDSLMSQYQLYKDYEEVLTRKGTDIQNTLAQKQRKLESSATAMQRKYENNGFQTRDELERAQQSLQQQEMELQQLAAKLNNEFNEEQARINQEARDSIQAFLKIYNQTKKYDYVMIKAGDNLLIANPKYNITKDIVTGLNKRYNAKK